MNQAERLLAALQREPIDRVPIAPIFNMPYLRRYGSDHDFVTSQIKACASEDFDPMILLKLDAEPGGWPNARQYWLLHYWPGASCPTWNIRKEILHQGGDNECMAYTIETPAGELHTVIEYDNYTHWIQEDNYLIKEEADISLLSYRPDPASLPLIHILDDQLARIGDGGLGYLYVPGVWHQACDLRGSTQLMYDVFDRPGWVRRLFGMLREYIVALVQQMAQSQLRILMINESYAGLGLSPSIFRSFILKDDRSIVQAIHEAGLPTVFHICGQSRALLELMADTGADGLETLTPPTAGGDVDLGEAKQRVGNRVCLRGGFDQHVLAKGDEAEIMSSVRRCLDQAAEGGGYILSPSGFLTEEVTLQALHQFYQAAGTHPAVQG